MASDRAIAEDAGDALATGTRTLGQLCTALGPLLIEVAAAPRGVDIVTCGVVLQDPHEPVPLEEVAGQLLLAVGAAIDDDATLDLVNVAAAAGASGIACRAGSLPGRLLEVAEAAGIALLSVPPDVAWGELYDLAKATLAIDDRQLTEQPAGVAWRGLNDLFSVAEATAAIAGGPVTIDDMQSRILAFSGGDNIDEGRRKTILNRQVPERWLQQMRELGVIEHLLKSDEVLHVEFPNLTPRRAIAIRLGERVLGSIWLASGDEPLSQGADEALRQAAPIAALHMMRQRIGTSVERRMRESRVAALLRGDEVSPRALERVGLTISERLVVVAMDVIAWRASSPAVIDARLIDLVAMHLRAYGRPAVATSLEERVFLLAGSRGEQDRVALRRVIETCVAHASKALGVDLRVGIGHEVGVVEELEQARKSAEDCLASSRQDQNVIAFEEIRSEAMLADIDRVVGSWRGGPSSTYRTLLELDEAGGSEYLRTLLSVLEAFGNLAKAAERLHLHANTVRYRVKRILELTDIDLEDGETRLALELELRAGLPRES